MARLHRLLPSLTSSALAALAPLAAACSYLGPAPTTDNPPDCQPPATDDPTPDAGPTECGLSRQQAVALPGPIYLAPGRGIGPVRWDEMPLGPLPPLHPPPRPAAASRVAAPARVALQLLVLGVDDEAPYLSARAALQRIGVPHLAVSLADTHFADVPLRDADGTCRFRGVILATSSLAIEDGGATESGLSDDEWYDLARYEQECDAREVVWYAAPGPETGLSEISSFGGTPVHGGLTDAGAAIFGDLVRGVDIDFSGAWGYLARADDPQVTAPLVVTAGGAVLVARHRRSDGTEVIAVTAGSGPRSLYAMMLQEGLVSWLMRGLYPGERRVYLTPQIDDVFLASAMWTPDGSPLTYRITPADVADFMAWQRGLTARLPAGSTFISRMAFNGAGAHPITSPDPLVAALLENRDKLGWINHTWDHAYMDFMSDAEAFGEVSDNTTLAGAAGFAAFDPAALVTPGISGLDNPDAISGMVSAGVRIVVSDTSITSKVDPENPGDNPSHNVGRPNKHNPLVYEVPRHPANVFYDASTPAQETGLYNQLYRNSNGRDLTYDEIIAADTAVALRYLFGYDADPLMFHQGNLRSWVGGDGLKHSIYGDWVDTLLDRYLAAMKLPVLSLTMGQLAELMKRRAAYNECGARVVLVDDGGAGQLEVSGAQDCVVPLSGLDAPGAGRVEHYGGEPTTFVELEPCEKRIIDLP